MGMGKGEEGAKVAANLINCFGGCAGVGVFIYFCVTKIQPALEDSNGINEEGADWITAAICLFGGCPLSAAAGILGCLIASLACTCLGLAAKGCLTKSDEETQSGNSSRIEYIGGTGSLNHASLFTSQSPQTSANGNTLMAPAAAEEVALDEAALDKMEQGTLSPSGMNS